MAPEPDRDESDADRLTVLLFTLGENRYCVRLEAVNSVVGVTDTGPLEDAPDPWNAGTVTVADGRVRIVDLPRVFTPASATLERVDEPALLVLRRTVEENVAYGWLVDNVGITATINATDLEAPRTSARLVRGRFERDGADVVLLDEEAIHG
ncbi:chemotaxis protein CheW [Salinadaptatus halalkaliphilus]|uniref:Chemotaxis protein CheW n=1 Tax=Salinadaptatus halalkaliphilus TaxID=2419781 RepID=A0A4S3TG69_9EURY|nr:chemotaxis protein CheW [Salinadaptatus halalkaliphilus]THE62846.1 chemotaxis protein CheW [Salinadaptatus halalkaliphilus]